MEFDLEPITLIVTGAFWIFVLFLVWYMPFGFSALRDKVILSIFSLPCIYLMVVMQTNR